jgi:hypothetical protein
LCKKSRLCHLPACTFSGDNRSALCSVPPLRGGGQERDCRLGNLRHTISRPPRQNRYSFRGTSLARRRRCREAEGSWHVRRALPANGRPPHSGAPRTRSRLRSHGARLLLARAARAPTALAALAPAAAHCRRAGGASPAAGPAWHCVLKDHVPRPSSHATFACGGGREERKEHGAWGTGALLPAITKLHAAGAFLDGIDGPICVFLPLRISSFVDLFQHALPRTRLPPRTSPCE